MSGEGKHDAFINEVMDWSQWLRNCSGFEPCLRHDFFTSNLGIITISMIWLFCVCLDAYDLAKSLMEGYMSFQDIREHPWVNRPDGLHLDDQDESEEPE